MLAPVHDCIAPPAKALRFKPLESVLDQPRLRNQPFLEGAVQSKTDRCANIRKRGSITAQHIFRHALTEWQQFIRWQHIEHEAHAFAVSASI